LNSQRYFNNISECLEVLAQRIKSNGKLNILDLNIHAETFYRDLINIVYKYELKSANVLVANFEAIDLIDETNKIIVQVSSTATKQKIESTLKKESIKDYAKKGYRLQFMFIADEASSLRTKKIANPHKIKFCAADDIYDKVVLLNSISQLEIGRKTIVNDLLENEFCQKPDSIKINNNLTTIIKLLSKENLSTTSNPTNLDYFNIDEKVTFNDLSLIKETTIDEYKVYYNKVDSIYKVFDHEGQNKRVSVLRKVTSFYEKEIIKPIENVERFFNVVNSIEEYILESNNIEEIEEDILEMCVRIIVVDAFIRCKIFRNPKEYSHVITK
jgi:hypothetical protein